MDWIIAVFCFQLGWIPNGQLIYYQPNSELYTGSIYNHFDATFKIDATLFDLIIAGGKMSAQFSFNTQDRNTFTPLNFTPTGMDYLVYIGIQITKDFSIQYEHSCSHPVATYLNIYQGSSSLDAGYDRVFLELKGSF